MAGRRATSKRKKRRRTPRPQVVISRSPRPSPCACTELVSVSVGPPNHPVCVATARHHGRAELGRRNGVGGGPSRARTLAVCASSPPVPSSSALMARPFPPLQSSGRRGRPGNRGRPAVVGLVGASTRSPPCCRVARSGGAGTRCAPSSRTPRAPRLACCGPCASTPGTSRAPPAAGPSDASSCSIRGRQPRGNHRKMRRLRARRPRAESDGKASPSAARAASFHDGYVPVAGGSSNVDEEMAGKVQPWRTWPRLRKHGRD